jgi:hypothetical protein
MGYKIGKAPSFVDTVFALLNQMFEPYSSSELALYNSALLLQWTSRGAQITVYMRILMYVRILPCLVITRKADIRNNLLSAK